MTKAFAPDTSAAQAVQIVPIAATGVPTRMPLAIVFGYVVATFALFLLWPIDWPIYRFSDWVRLIAYVSLCLAVAGLAAFAGSSGQSRVTAPFAGIQWILVAGAIVSVAILFPATFAYTGTGPWDVLDALRDQAAAYRRLQIQLFATEGQRTTIAAMRAIGAPLTFAVLPLGIIHWRTIGIMGRAAVLVTVAASVVFSILRGTDKEIADMFVVGIAAAFVSYGRSRTLGHQGLELFRRYWKPFLVGIVFLFLAQGLFTERKDARLGGYVSRTAVCANESRICADLDNPAMSLVPLRQRFGMTVFILSTCSGYYGLALALEKPFESTFGLGHSPAITSVYEAVTGDRTLRMRTFTYRNSADRWSDEYYWSTLITWIANDVGFIGAVFVLGLVGYMWGRWWREAAAGMSDPAAVLFCVATLAIFYLPANNQVLASYDGYVVLAVWIIVWLWHRRRRTLAVAVAES